MRTLWWGILGLVLVGGALRVPVATGQDATDAPGQLWLTDHRLEDRGEPTCPQALAYALEPDPLEVAEGGAASSLSGPVAYSSCPTYFTYAAPVRFQLGATVRLVLALACEPASASLPLPDTVFQARAMITRDPNGRPATSVDQALGAADWTTFGEAPGACGTEGVVLEGDLAAGNMTLEPGDPFTLLVWLRYASPPPDTASGPLVRIVTGPDASRLEGAGFPPPQAADGVALSDPRPKVYWQTQALETRDIGECLGIPVFALEAQPSATEAEIPAGRSLPVGGCVVIFSFDPDDAVTVYGPVLVEFWFRCAQPTLGFDGYFTGYLYNVAADGTEEVVGRQAIAGTGASVGTCATEPRATFMQALIDPPVALGPSDRLELRISAHYATGPEAEPVGGLLRYVVGPDFPASMAVRGLDGNLTVPGTLDEESPPTGPTGDADTERPSVSVPGALPGLVAIAALAGASVRRRRV